MKIDRDRLRTGWPWLASALVVLVTGTVVTVVNTRDDRLATPTGRFVDTQYGIDASKKSATVTLPLGELEVGLTGLLDRIDDSMQARDRRPPEDGSFVGLTTSLRQTHIAPATGDAAYAPIEITVVADGRRYPVPTDGAPLDRYSLPAGAQVHGYLAVAGAPRDIVVEIGFDGQRQTVNPRTGRSDAGRFAEIPTTSKRFTERECGPLTVTAGFRGADTSCIVQNSLRVPWIGGLGWAPAGQVWQAVGVYLGRNLSVTQTSTGRRYFAAPYGNTVSMTIAGRSSKGSLDDNSAPPEARTSTSTGFFLVPRGSGPATVRVSVAFPNLVPSSDASPTTQPDPSVVVSWKESVS